MMNFIELLKVLVQLYPLIVQIIQVVEAQFPEGGKGAEKLELVKQLLAAAYESSNDIKETFDSTWPAIRRVIESLVDTYNRLGVFKK